MRSLVFILLFFSLFTSAKSQNIGDLIFGVDEINLPHEELESFKPTISSFLSTSTNRAGILFGAYNNTNFKIMVNVVQIDGDKIQMSGMPVWVGEYQFEFNIYETNSGNQFSTHSIMVKQSGDSENDLFRQVIKGLNSKRNEFTKFMEKTKDEILGYYTTNLDRILSEAESLKSRSEYDAAFILLGQIPREIVGYPQVLTSIDQIFQAKIDAECETRIADFNIFKGQSRYDEAFEVLFELPQGSKCKAKTVQLINELQNEVCSVYIESAESNFNFGYTDEALQSLLGLEKLTPECSKRKTALESNIRARLDEEALRKWNKEMQEYNDRIELTKKKMQFEFDTVNKQLQSESQYRLKKLDVEAKKIEADKNRPVVVVQPSSNNRTRKASSATEYVLLRTAMNAVSPSRAANNLNSYYTRLVRSL